MQTTAVLNTANATRTTNAEESNATKNNAFASEQKHTNPFSFNFQDLPIQAKLKINAPNDRYEQEADRIADKVVNMNTLVSVEKKSNQQINRKPLLAEISKIETISAQRTCAHCEEEEEEEIIQRKTSNNATPISADTISSQLNATRGKGGSMDSETNQYMSSRFGVDFSHINIHIDEKAASMSRAINAKAFVIGNDIYFNKGEYQPHSIEGKRLIAHELVHTVQQNNSSQSQTLQRSGGTFFGFFRDLGRGIASIFGDEPGYDDETIENYLNVLRGGEIEDDFDSDNKARAVVNRWSNGSMSLTVDLKVLLIREMISGLTGDADETAILNILKGSTKELSSIFAQVSQDEIIDEFDGEELTQLQAFLGSPEGEQNAGCEETQTAQMNDGLSEAISMLNQSIAILEDENASSFVTNALWLMFRTSNSSKLFILRRLRSIKEQFSNIEISCVDENTEESCAYFSGFVRNHENPVYICTNNITSSTSVRELGKLLIHEASHLFFTTVIDHGYYGGNCEETLDANVPESENPNPIQERATDRDTSSERLENADSYSCLVNILSDPRRTTENEADREGYEQEIENNVQTQRGNNFGIVRDTFIDSLHHDSVDLYADFLFAANDYLFELVNTPTTGDISYSWKLYKGAGISQFIQLESTTINTNISDHLDILKSENITEGTLECTVEFRLVRDGNTRTVNVRRHLTFDHSGGTTGIQPKLKINASGDRYEQEADSFADKVVNINQLVSVDETSKTQINRKPLLAEISKIDSISAQTKCSQCEEEEELVQAKTNGNTANISAETIYSQLNATRGRGSVMDATTNKYMSSRFGVDFSKVNIHNNTTAANMNQSINARAFTSGNDIYFNKGQYNPSTTDGKRLLAHELVHTVQQKSNEVKFIYRQESPQVQNDGTQIVNNLITLIEEQGEAFSLRTSQPLSGGLETLKSNIEVGLAIFESHSVTPALQQRLRSTYVSAVSALILSRLGNTTLSLHQLYENNRNNILGFALPQAIVDSAANELSVELESPLPASPNAVQRTRHRAIQAARRQIKVNSIVTANIQYNRFFSTRIAAVRIPLPSNTTVRYSSSINQNLHAGLSSLAAEMISSILHDNTAVLIALDLTSFGGGYSAYRFTRLNLGTLGSEILIERQGTIGIEGLTDSQRAVYRERFDNLGFRSRGSFSQDEFDQVLIGLQQIPERQLSSLGSLTIERQSEDSDDPNVGGHYDQSDHTVRLFDNAFNATMVRQGSAGNILQSGSTAVIHEIGHALDLSTLRQTSNITANEQQALLDEFGTGDRRYEIPHSSHEDFERYRELETALNIARSNEDTARAHSGAGWVPSGNDTSVSDTPRRASRAPFRRAAIRDGGSAAAFPTHYPNPDSFWQEYFAESYSLYITSPQVLSRNRPNVYQYFFTEFPSP